MLNLINGLAIQNASGEPTQINYDVPKSWSELYLFLRSDFSGDLGQSFVFTIQSVIPTSYLPGFNMGTTCPSDPGDFLVLLANSVVLILMIVFTAIGLKRHFRQF